MSAPVRTPIAAPVARRFFDRLTYWHTTGPFFAHVREIVLGWPRLSIPNTFLLNPVTMWVSALPQSASGGISGTLTSNTHYQGIGQIACVGSDVNELDGLYQMADTLDDLIQVVCEVEQQTKWGTVGGTYGEAIRALANLEVTIEYPNLDVKDTDNKVVGMHHMAIARWVWIADKAWA